MSRVKIVHAVTIAYSLVAFSGAGVFFRGLGVDYVLADSRSNWETRNKLEEASRDILRLQERQSQIETHLESNDTRINDLQSKISFIEGSGGSFLAALGVLNAVGLFMKPKGRE